jgi:hypothetical protein
MWLAGLIQRGNLDRDRHAQREEDERTITMTKGDLFWLHRCLNTCKSINAKHHINRIKDRNNIII